MEKAKTVKGPETDVIWDQDQDLITLKNSFTSY